MVVGRIERYLVGMVGVVVALVVTVNAALFIKAEFEKAAAAFSKIGAVKALR
jgi:hypothetical protein